MITKSVAELIELDPSIRVIAINVRGGASQISASQCHDLLLTYDPDWKAWNTRKVPKPYQQVCVFRSLEEIEAKAKKMEEVQA